jgi:hypothetical protein
MKPLTLLISLIHLCYIVGIMWLGPFLLYLSTSKCRLVYWTLAWVVCILVQLLHWGTSVMRNECILSYWEKKAEDPSYVKGSEPDKTYAWILLRNILGNRVTIEQIRAFHLVMSKVAFLFAVCLLTLHNQCFPKRSSETAKLIAYAGLSGLVLRYLCFDSGYCTKKIV